MERPWIVLVVLIVLAIATAAIVGGGRTVERTMPERMNEKMRQDAKEEYEKSEAMYKNAASDPKRLKLIEESAAGAVKAEMEIENVGKIEMEFYPQAAPKTVAHIVDLINKNFYTGVRFHRVIKDFVAQVGDPKSKTTKKADYAGKSSEEVGTSLGLGQTGSGTAVPLEKKLPHLVNSIGLARSVEPDSGDSQFYFNLIDNARLDRDYCVFGKVTKGAELLPKISLGDAITSFKVLK
jgi:cyclophilin family peptidyl-prolyl cis-trans isomerase/Na+-transporting methylmalonyl-CoA/oxaloacetate decarboxylase gamma subunit